MTSEKIPRWVYAVIVVLASVGPLSHFWIAGYESGDGVPSGLSNADSAIYLQCMRMLRNGFYSPYASCKALNGPNDIAFLPAPFHWLYAVLGVFAGLARVDDFLFLGLANGVCGAIYLYVTYHFLRVAAPRQANLAFLLFALGGGLGGVLYAVTGAFDMHGAADFERYFWPAAMYELVEGPYLSPVLHMPRLYYTVSLSLCLGGLTAFIRGMRIGCGRHLGFATLLFFSGAFVHIRLGGFALAVAIIYLLGARTLGRKVRVQAGVCITLALCGAFAGFFAMSIVNPVFMQNTGVLVRESMWPSAFVSVALLHLLIIPKVILSKIRRLPFLLAVLSWCAIGYLAVFSILFVGYTVYFGNSLGAGDAAAAMAISDWALLGAVAGGLFGAMRKPGESSREDLGAWVVPWLLIFIVVGLSAWGQGWFQRLTPQRVMLFMGLPLSILSATALQAWGRRRARVARGYVAVMIACGVMSLIVSTLYIQGPLGRAPGEGPFAELYRGSITSADALLLESLAPGIVLAPVTIGDVVALQPELRVLGGAGTTDLSDLMSTEIHPAIARFFSAGPAMDRKAFLDEWCIDFVYCPDTWPVEADVVKELKGEGALEVVIEQSRGIVFRVRRRSS